MAKKLFTDMDFTVGLTYINVARKKKLELSTAELNRFARYFSGEATPSTDFITKYSAETINNLASIYYSVSNIYKRMGDSVDTTDRDINFVSEFFDRYGILPVFGDLESLAQTYADSDEFLKNYL